ncbi:hypothetical protein, partial [Azospirillum oleiclasticum]|uniref:hypothetical protein n=1 Tax=Azospirillum oleiclasticum TaxID=2735135 RepID=UPI001B3BC306
RTECAPDGDERFPFVAHQVRVGIDSSFQYPLRPYHPSVWHDQSVGSGIALRMRRAIRRNPLVK